MKITKDNISMLTMFVIFVIVMYAIMCDSCDTGTLIIIILGILGIYSVMMREEKVKKTEDPTKVNAEPAIPDTLKIDPATIHASEPEAPVDHSKLMTGPQHPDRMTHYNFDQWKPDPTYTTCYGASDSAMYVGGSSIDEKAMQQSTRRNNEKRVMDGAVSKNMYYYRKNFADELSQEEQRPWWGRDEY
jgi:hypothetical protein